MPTALTIAGSDSGGGAGVQADLKTFAAHGVYGTSAIAALTAQNTIGVSGVHVVGADFVTAQIEAVVSDIGCDAVKTGMLANSTIVEAVAAAVESWSCPTSWSIRSWWRKAAIISSTKRRCTRCGGRCCGWRAS